MISELSLGQKVRAQPKRKWRDFQTPIKSITADFNTYREGKKVSGVFGFSGKIPFGKNTGNQIG